MSPDGVSDTSLVEHLVRQVLHLQKIQSRWQSITTGAVLLAIVGILLAGVHFTVAWHTVGKLSQMHEKTFELCRQAEQCDATVRELQWLFAQSEGINHKLNARIIQVLNQAEELASINMQLVDERNKAKADLVRAQEELRAARDPRMARWLEQMRQWQMNSDKQERPPLEK